MSTCRTAMIILGASGDLARRKLIPALRRLYEEGVFDASCAVIGSGRTAFDDDSFRRHLGAERDFASLLHYHQGLDGLREYVEALGTFDQTIVFFSLPPRVYADTAAALAQRGFGDRTRLIIEKPFGYDYDSARDLNRRLGAFFNEQHIYRIDHYLAKEAVRNILVFRFANSLFDPVWNSRYLESIQINACEEEGVGHRAQYFDGAGVIRDMVQNHLMQLLCLMTMEAPVSLDAEDIRAQKLAVLKSLKIEECRRGQYEGYREEEGVRPDSSTETYAEIRASISNFRWTGMPIFIRTGKAVHRKGTEIGVRFKSVPRLLFNEEGLVAPNRIVFKIQPAEGILLDLAGKDPGDETMQVTTMNMAFCYRSIFPGEIPEAYRKLLADAIRGDRTLFVGARETELSWKLLQPFLDKGDPTPYPRGGLPESKLLKDWIDFDAYKSMCAS